MSFYLSVAVMALTTYLIRMLPLTLFRKRIENRFLRSFLYYVPPACLTAMTIPAIFTSAPHPISGAVGLISAVIAAACRQKLPVVAAICCAAVLAVEGIFLLG